MIINDINLLDHVLVNYSTTLHNKLIQLFKDCSDCLLGNLKLPFCNGIECFEWSNPTMGVDVYRHWHSRNIG
jgi:hypothetical protein